MKLIPDWRKVLKKAWSVKCMLLAGAFTCAEVLLPLYSAALPRGIFAGLSTLAILGGLYFRVVLQKEISDGK